MNAIVDGVRDFSDAEKTEEMVRQMLRYPVMFCDPVLIGRPPDLGGDLGPSIYSGTITYLELNGRKIGVTNAHVIRKFEGEREHDGVSILQLPTLIIRDDLHARLIDIDDEADLATLDFNDVELPPRESERIDLRERWFYKPAQWPPEPPVQADDVVAYAGFPGSLRKDSADLWTIENNPYSMIGMQVRQATGNQFTVRLNRDDMKLAFGRTESDEKDFEFGGMSGGPVFRRSSSLYVYPLVGIIKEYRSPPYDFFVFAALDSIKSTGELWHNTGR